MKSPSPKPVVSNCDPAALGERIRARAYELFEERGREQGHDWEDWFRAEQEITGGKVDAATA